MSEQRPHIIINVVIRAIVGIAVIFFVNQLLVSRGVSVKVGLNAITVLTSGVLGMPGVALLYGISLYQML